MKMNAWKLLFALGWIPFLLPVVLGFYRMSIESWAMVDWLIMYSFVYWPTYLAGVILMGISAVKLIKRKK